MELLALKIIYYSVWAVGLLGIQLLLLEVIDRFIVMVVKRMGIFPALAEFIWDRTRRKNQKD